MTSDGWKLVPVEPTRKMLDEGGFYFIQGGGSVSDSDMAQAKRVYRAMLAAAPSAPQAEPRLRECAQRLVTSAEWGLAGALNASSKSRDIPSSARSVVKARHLAALRDALSGE